MNECKGPNEMAYYWIGQSQPLATIVSK